MASSGRGSQGGIVKKFFLVVLVAVVTGAAIAFMLLLAAELTVLSPDAVKDELAQSDVYDSVLVDGPDELLPRLDPDEEFYGHSIEEVGRVIRNQLDAEDVREVAEPVVDQVFLIISGGKDDYVLRIPLGQVKDKVSKGFPEDDPIQKEFGKVPDVFRLDLAELAEDENPPSIDVDRPIIIGLWVSGVVAVVGLILVGVLSGPALRRRFRWLGISLLIPSGLTLVYSVVSSLIIGGIEFFSFGELGTLVPDTFGRAFGEFISSVILGNLAFVRWESLGVAAVGLVLLALSFGPRRGGVSQDTMVIEDG